MEGLLSIVLLGLTSLVSAHYPGYPFTHKNNGRYGAQYEIANYKVEDKPEATEEGATTVTTPPILAGKVAEGNRFGFIPRDAKGDGKLEFKYRQHSGFPVHLGNGQFYFLGDFSKVACTESKGNGFYFTGDPKSYTVCENSRAHKFACPMGTRNKDATYFLFKHKYDRSDLCSEHDTPNSVPVKH